jgi:hypothetical protein
MAADLMTQRVACTGTPERVLESLVAGTWHFVIDNPWGTD